MNLPGDAWQALFLGALSALALPPLFFLPVLWISVPGLLRLLARSGGWKRAAWIGWCFGFGFNLIGLFWVTEPMLITAKQFWWAVPIADPGLSAAVAFYMLIPCLLAYRLRPGLAMILIFAGGWVMSNLAQQFLFTGFPWNFWGADWALPGWPGTVMIQPAAIAGIHGLTLLTVIIAALPLLGRRGWYGIGAIMACWIGFGLWRVSRPAPGMRNFTVAMIQPGFAVPGSWARAALLARWRRELAMTRQAIAAAGPGPKAVIWPESASPFLLQTDGAARAALASVAGKVPVIAGTIRIAADDAPRNSLAVVEGAGPLAAYYDKWKLVPFGEYTPSWIPVKITPGGGFTPGPGPRTLSVPGVPPFGPLICYESIFSGEIVDRHMRPDWLVNITDNAWFGDSTGPRQDFATTRLRAVEEGLPLAVDANSGISAVIGPRGKVLARLGLDRRGILVHRLPAPIPAPLYARFGLTIAGILALYCLALGVAVLILAEAFDPDLPNQELSQK
ncbi:MAG TPA: apolipoprotein N-acyltransferase [Acetobacteraceae bacterium]|nr:apolipoprotein N-acyltransferase [Acetobacteraceae bacterium]